MSAYLNASFLLDQTEIWGQINSVISCVLQAIFAVWPGALCCRMRLLSLYKIVHCNVHIVHMNGPKVSWQIIA